MAKSSKKSAQSDGKTLAELVKLYKEKIEDLSAYDKVEVIPSGSVIIDHITGIGGYPRGRITELWGDEGVSKTTLALHATAECQRLGLAVAYFDFEGSFCNAYAKKLGVDIYDTSKFLYIKPASFEAAESELRGLAACGEVGLVVIDSVSAMTPQDLIEGSAGLGLLARKLSGFLSCLVKDIQKGNTACLATNQIRTKIATQPGERSYEYSTGGKALQFYNSLKIRLRVGEKSTEKSVNPVTRVPEERVTKCQIKAESVKNKFSPPFVKCTYWLRYGEGVDNGASIFDMAMGRNMFTSSGSWMYFQFPWGGEEAGKFKVQGEDNVRRMVSESKELQKVCLASMSLTMSPEEICSEKEIQADEGKVII